MSTYYYMYPTCKISKKKKKWCKIGVKWSICPNQQQGPVLEISYHRLSYHRLYQISSLEANLSLEDMKQLCVDRSHIHTGISPYPQN